MPHAEVGVQNDPIHAIVAAAQEILIQSAQPICHGGYARRTPVYFKLPRRGHFFAAQSAKKRSLLQQHIAPWQAWHAERSERHAVPLDVPPALAEEFLVSTIVLRSHLDKTYPGAMVASLSIPWGDSGNERGGYHLVWPRDLVETAGALLALGAEQEARDTLRYLIATQIEDGHWYQNQWLGGRPYWEGIQLDETAFPVLLAATLDEREALSGIEVEDMVP